MSELNDFKNKISTLEAVIDTNKITENNTEYIQVTWPHNPAKSAVPLHKILKQYDNITQVVPSDQLRENNPENAEFTQYFTIK